MPSSSGPSGSGDRIGRFRLLGRLGSGAMGVVHDALEENLDRRVALKVIAPDLAGDPDFRARFAVEARALASLDSPHVVAVHAYGEEDGHLYLATQLIADGDLGRLLRERGPLPLGRAAALVAQVAEGLADAHAAGLAHRDVKPANVLVRRRGTGPTATLTAYLGDFGIARDLDDEVVPGDGSHGPDGSAVAGTPSYLAPELHQGAPAGVTSDLYSVGCLLWVVLTGSPPYPGATEGEILRAHHHAPVPQLHGSGDAVDALDRVLRRALAKSPADRYQQASDLAADLRRVAELADGPALHARPGSPPVLPAAAAPTGGRGLRILVAALALAVVTGVGLAVLAVLLPGESPNGDDTAAGAAGLDEDGVQLLAAAVAEMGALDTVRVSGDVRSGDELLGVDLAVSARGDCVGTISLGDGSARLRRVGARTWFRADEAFWVAAAEDGQGRSIARAVGDRWVLVPPEDAASFGPVCDLDALLSGPAGPPGPQPAGRRTAEVVGTATDSGREVLRVATGADTPGLPGGPGAVVSVALADPHHLLHVESGLEGTLRFSDFDTPFEVRAPASSAVVDLRGFGE